MVVINNNSQHLIITLIIVCKNHLNLIESYSNIKYV